MCDGEQIELPEIEGITLINISSQCGGADFWSNYSLSGKWKKQKSADRMIEVVGMRDSIHLGKCIVGLSDAVRICQGNSIHIEINAPFKIPMQIDGEAFQLDDQLVDLDVSYFDTIKVMKNVSHSDDKDSKYLKLLKDCVTDGVLNADQMAEIKERLYKME